MLTLTSEATQHFVDGAQRVKREPKRYAMHGCYHRLEDARRCAGGVLEVVEMSER
jgi:hypothetical protein